MLINFEYGNIAKYIKILTKLDILFVVGTELNCAKIFREPFVQFPNRRNLLHLSRKISISAILCYKTLEQYFMR